MRTKLGFLLVWAALTFPTAPTDCQGAGKASSEDWTKYVVAAPEVIYPEIVKRNGKGGSGTFYLTINPKNGTVSEVKVLRRRGDRLVIAIYVMNFFEWRFRPGTISSVTISRGAHVTGVENIARPF